jgi:hypothetical protein
MYLIKMVAERAADRYNVACDEQLVRQQLQATIPLLSLTQMQIFVLPSYLLDSSKGAGKDM